LKHPVDPQRAQTSVKGV